jgi:predicted O-methyltransferase YrrM
MSEHTGLRPPYRDLGARAVTVVRTRGVSEALRKSRRYLSYVGVLNRVAAVRLRHRARGVGSVDEALDLAYGFRSLGLDIEPAQVRSEFRALLELAAARSPRAVLEIGTAQGGTLFLFSRTAEPEAILVSVDLPAELGGYARERGRLYQSYRRARQSLHLVRADSHARTTFESVRDLFAGRAVDVLFIDGDHTYEGARADYETYRELVAPGGLIAFHDIVPSSEDRVGGVPQLWRELRGQPGARELVESWKQDGYGIGVIELPRD